MSSNQKLKIQRQNADREAAKLARREHILSLDYSAASSFEELHGDLSVDEIKALMLQNTTFKNASDRLDGQDAMTISLAQSPGEAQALADSERVAAEEAQAAVDRATAEEAAGTNLSTEKLYEGVEKGDFGGGNFYRLTIDPEDGSNPEIFYGVTQAQCWAKLRESKKNATRELRRRAKKVQITKDLENLEVEKVSYPPLLKKITLTPDETYVLTEELKDPVTSLAAMEKLRQASMSQPEIDLLNENVTRQREAEAHNIASQWIVANPEFYLCPENIAALQDLMGRLDWACTIRNLSFAFQTLKDQGVLIDRPEGEAPAVVTVAPVAQPPAHQARPAAPATPAKVYRPKMTTLTGTQRMDTIRTAPKTTGLTPEEYNRMPASVLKSRYDREPAFKAQVDRLLESGQV